MAASAGAGDLLFTRVDVTQVGQTAKATMRVLPDSKPGTQQKIVVGDETGALACFGLKKGDLDSRFRTLPTGTPVTRVELGGPSKGSKEGIFFATGHSILGISRKGREFFKFETSLTEPIRNLVVEGPHIYCSGDYSYYHFVDCDDKEFFMCHDKIEDFFCCTLTSDSELDSVLGCHDRMLRVLQGDQVLYEIPAEASVTALHRYDREDALTTTRKGSRERKVIYGMSNGGLSCFTLSNAGFETRWSIPASATGAGVQCLSSADVVADGCADLLVGRDDGSVEVYAFPDRNIDSSVTPVRRFHANLNESIQSIDHGSVVAPKFDDIVVATYSGKVVAYSPEATNVGFAARPEAEMQERAFLTGNWDELRRKIRATESEIFEMELKLKDELTKHNPIQQTQPPSQQSSKQQPQHVTVDIPVVEVNVKFALVEREECYHLSFETKSPIEYIALQSADLPPAHLAIEEADKSSCVISPSAAGSAREPYVAVCRLLNKDSYRIELIVRPVEGHYGCLKAYVSPFMLPRTAQLVTVVIKPLALHTRVNALSERETMRPMSEVKVTGAFTLAEIHAWLAACLPEIPDKVVSEGDAMTTMYWRSVFTKSVVVVSYKKGEASFSSDSLPTLSIIKDFIGKMATERGSKIHFSNALKDASVTHLLDLIHLRCEEQFNLKQKYLLLDPIKELQVHEQDVLSFLSPDLVDVATHTEEIRSNYKQQQMTLERLYGVIADLYRARHTLRGRQVIATKEAELQNILTTYNLDALKQFFAS